MTPGIGNAFDRLAIGFLVIVVAGVLPIVVVHTQGWQPPPAVRLGAAGAALAATFLVWRMRVLHRRLAKAKAHAEATSAAKTQFLATMSHEIRTPMNGILGMAQVLDAQDLPDAERRQCVRTLLHSGQTLLALLNDILDLSKVEAGKLDLHVSECSPVGIAHEIARLFSDAAHAKALSIAVDATMPAASHVVADPVRLRQMLSNLVGNAVKFTATGGVRIEVRELPEDGGGPLLEYAVLDTGVGIPPAQMGRLFQDFSQVDGGAGHPGGSGLGLSIVRQLAAMMGGEAGASSVEGRGSRFWFRVRVGRVQACDERLAPPTVATTTPAGARADGATGRLSGRVLVAEDNPVNRKVIEAALTRLGLTVRLVADGLQAFEAVESDDSFDLVLMDVRMPVMDGLASTARIRAREAAGGLPRIPIVAITANAYDDDRRECEATGMDDFVSKPVDFDALATVLGRWLPTPHPGDRAATARPAGATGQVRA